MQRIRQLKREGATRPTVIYLRAGNHATCMRLMDLLNGGVQEFTYSAGSKIMAMEKGLAGELQCPLIVQSTEGEQYTRGSEGDQGGMPPSYILRSQTRLRMGYLRAVDSAVLSRIPRTPLSKDEVKERMGYRYEKDKRQCFAP